MRYDNANAYQAGSVTYYMNHAPGTFAELSGITLCDKPVGDGVNDQRFKPRSRYGDADTASVPARGNCKAQLCVNDRYH